MIGEPYLYGYGRCAAPPEWDAMPMGACNRLYVVYNGRGWYMEDGRRRCFARGHLYFFPVNAMFRVGQAAEDPLEHMYFDFLLAPPPGTARIAAVDLNIGAAHTEALRGSVRALEWLLTIPAAPARERALRVTLAALLHQLHAAGKTLLQRDIRVAAALQRIHAVREDGTLDLPRNGELAALLFLEVNHFIRVFKREMGCTPYQYILNHRLNVAAAHIADGRSLSDAAHITGYESPAALSHALSRRRSLRKTV